MLFSQLEISYYLIPKSARIKIKISDMSNKELLAEGAQFSTNCNLKYTAWPTKALEQALYHRQSCIFEL